ncbi:hypothetical protein BDR05DRAFT_998712 [Suillus weaverae]|nr:hypothetical protein BDR05DRAFT_998712 [Suillus weaverae]
MAASSTPTEQTWHPRSLLPYDALPHCQDFDLIISDAKSTVESRTDFYDRSLASRRYALVGVACSSIISCSCIIAGIITLARQGVSGVMVTNIVSVEPMSAMIQITQLDLQRELLALILNLIITLCTEPIGFVHGISLRSALASESRLHFNTNLRLLTAARGWYNPNGALLNGIMAILLIISYTSSSVVLCYNFSLASDGSDIAVSIAIAGLPLLSLGVALLLQVMIALSGMWAVKILTWSSSPFDLTAALVHHAQLTPVTFRCMRCVSDRDVDGGPAKPSETQPSAWQAHPSIQRIVISLWGLVAACAGWAALIMYIWDKHASARMTTNPALPMWSFFPNGNPSAIAYTIPGLNVQGWILIFVNLAVVQAPLTLGLHYSELIANVIRDERQWRCATRRKGLQVATNPLKSIFTHPVSLVLFLAKPFLHWMFGLSFFVDDLAGDEIVESFSVGIYTAQIWNLCIALAIFACFFTLVALRRPRGPQPATYGHIQTLANLVDEWSPVMWWGHKQDQIPYCHAGTSDHLLPDVKMDCVYAGFRCRVPAFENTFLD